MIRQGDCAHLAQPPHLLSGLFCGVQPAFISHGWDATVAGKYIVYGTVLKAFAGYKPQLFNVREPSPSPSLLPSDGDSLPVCSLTSHVVNVEEWRKWISFWATTKR